MTATAVAAPVRRDTTLTERVFAAGRAAGLVAVGATTADRFDDVRDQLETRRTAGYAAAMQFTYRNPARSTDPSRILSGARSLVAGAWPTDAIAPPDAPINGGRVARYVWRDHYGALRVALEAMAEVLRSAGFAAVIAFDDNALVDRAVAHRAGLGWYGKNSNVLVPEHGSWVVLGSVVTTASLVAAEVPVADGCGSCSRCIDGCPTAAIVAPGIVDARRCLAWLVQAEGTFPPEYRVALGDRIYGCDDCQEVCPPSKVAARVVTRQKAANWSREPAENARLRDQFVDLVEVVRASDEELLAAHGRWYIARRDPRHLKRNALIALGNTAPVDDVEVEGLLRSVVAGGDELLAEHAQWALDRVEARRIGA